MKETIVYCNTTYRDFEDDQGVLINNLELYISTMVERGYKVIVLAKD